MRFLAPDELRGLDARALEELLERRDALVVAGDGEVEGFGAAALLLADYSAIETSGAVAVDSAAGWAGVVWRLGRGALRIHVDGVTRFGAAAARAEGLVDEVYSGGADAWMERWLQGRSVDALDAAAALIRVRGGDQLERVAFARLFASGEPQKGLEAFLGKRSPRF